MAGFGTVTKKGNGSFISTAIRVPINGLICPCGQPVTVMAWGGHLTPLMKKITKCQICRDREKIMSMKRL